MNKKHAIVYFDGVCNLCNGAVQFIIVRDQAAYFQYASLQSERGQEVLHTLNKSTDKLESFILEEEGAFYERSTAALRIMKKLGSGWRILAAVGFATLRVLPLRLLVFQVYPGCFGDPPDPSS